MIRPYVTQLNYTIPKTLREFVVAVILGESKDHIQEHIRVHPTGYPLIIYVFEDIPTIHVQNRKTKSKTGFVLAGQITDGEISMEIDGKLGQVGVVLYPTAAYYLFHKPGGLILNKWKDISVPVSLSENKTDDYLDNSAKLFSYVDMIFSYLVKLLPKRLEKIQWLENALLIIFKKDGLVSQQVIAERVSISLRHFRRKFREIIGVSPKYYCKVVQLNTVFELLKSDNSEKLNWLALDCGYYDQAHFIHDFKKFIGDSPRAFLNSQQEFVKTYLGRKS